MFRILSFTIHGDTFLGGKKFEISDPGDQGNATNHYSIVIGPNGTGKSYLLSNLIEALNEIAMLKGSESYKPRKKFTLEFKLGNYKFKISTENKEPIFERDGKQIQVAQVKLPSKWLASSVTINDKFPIFNSAREEQIPQYKYLGIRSASNNAFIGRITINTVINLIAALKKGEINTLASIYSALGLNSELQLEFSPGTMLQLSKIGGKYTLPRSAKKVVEPHQSFLRNSKTKTSYRADVYKKYLDSPDDVKDVYSFMVRHRNEFEKSSKSEIQFKYGIDLKNHFGNRNLLFEWEFLSKMLDLELIKISNFQITKNKPFNYEDASSGESHLLAAFHGIIANLKHNSLLIIDEPEISLHPNWQIKYLELLKVIFKDHKDCHIIIATHSHFLVSDLNPETSSILALKIGKDFKPEPGVIKYSSYGWSVEQILLEIFEVPTTRNIYLSDRISAILKLLSKSKLSAIQEKRLKKEIEWLKDLNLKIKAFDPLKEVIKAIVE